MAKTVILTATVNGTDGKLHKPGETLTFDNALAKSLVLRGKAKWPPEEPSAPGTKGKASAPSQQQPGANA